MITVVSHLRFQPSQRRGRHQTMRLWHLWRTHQLDREHVRWHLDIHERELFFTSVSRRLFNVDAPKEQRCTPVSNICFRRGVCDLRRSCS